MSLPAAHPMFPRALSMFLLASAAALPQARATLTYDVRMASGNPKSYTGLSVNQVLNLELYAVVTGAAGNGAQEGFQEGYVTVIAGFGGGSQGNPVQGNLSGTLTTTFAASGSQNGTAQDLDGDGDKDLGSNATFSSGDFIRARAASMQTSSGTVITDGREFKLANLTFTVTAINNPLDPTPIPLYCRVTNFTSPIEIEAVWQQDGIQSSMTLSPGGTFPNSFPTVGSPVMLRAIPEPGSAGLLLLGTLVSYAHRPRGPRFRRAA